MKEKPVQYFDPEYIQRCKDLSPDEIVEFLENFRDMIADQPEKCQLISLKIEPSLLNSFKYIAKMKGIPYQTLIKKIMRDWLKNNC